MEVENTAAGVDASNNADGNGSPTEEITSTDAEGSEQATGTAETDYKQLYENQKIRAEKAEAALKGKPEVQNYDPEAIAKTAEEAARRTYEEQYLNEQGYPDEIKTEIETVAKVQGISLREAAQHGYIKAQMEEYQRQQRVATASPDASGGGNAGYVFDPENPPDVDVSTPEGQKAIEEWERQLEQKRGK